MYKKRSNLGDCHSRDNKAVSKGKRRAKSDRQHRCDPGNEVDYICLGSGQKSSKTTGLSSELSCSPPFTCKQSGKLTNHTSTKKLKEPLDTLSSTASSSMNVARSDMFYFIPGKKSDAGDHREIDAKVNGDNCSRSNLQPERQDPAGGADVVPKSESRYTSLNYTNISPGLESLAQTLAALTSPCHIFAPSSGQTDNNVFQFRKHVDILIMQQCWMVGKIIHLKKELNLIIKKMEEAIEESQVCSLVRIPEVLNSAEETQSVKDIAYNRCNVLQMKQRDLPCNIVSSDLSLPTSNVSDKSSLRKSSIQSNNNVSYDCCWNSNINMEDELIHGRQTRLDKLTSSRDGSSVCESLPDLCVSATHSFPCGTCYLLQFLFVIVLLFVQVIIQFVTIRR